MLVHHSPSWWYDPHPHSEATELYPSDTCSGQQGDLRGKREKGHTLAGKMTSYKDHITIPPRT